MRKKWMVLQEMPQEQSLKPAVRGEMGNESVKSGCVLISKSNEILKRVLTSPRGNQKPAKDFKLPRDVSVFYYFINKALQNLVAKNNSNL